MRFNLNEQLIPSIAYKVLPWSKIKNLKAMPVKDAEGALGLYKKIGWRLVQTCLEEDGIGLAAPQVGMFKRMFLIREFKRDENGNYEFQPAFKLYINPEWTGDSEAGKMTEKEYCLSVSGGFPIARFNKIEATWQEFSEEGGLVTKTETIEGFPARIFQHEFDHLTGISIPQRWEMQNKPKPKAKKKKRKKK